MQTDNLLEKGLRGAGLKLDEAIEQLRLAQVRCRIGQCIQAWEEWLFGKRNIEIVEGDYDFLHTISDTWNKNSNSSIFFNRRVIVQMNNGQLFGANCPAGYEINIEGRNPEKMEPEMWLNHFLEKKCLVNTELRNEFSHILAVYHYHYRWHQRRGMDKPECENVLRIYMPNYDWTKLRRRLIDTINKSSGANLLSVGVQLQANLRASLIDKS